MEYRCTWEINSWWYIFCGTRIRADASFKSHQDEKDRKTAKLEEQKELHVAKELKETKSNQIQKLETEIEAEMNSKDLQQLFHGSVMRWSCY